MSKYINIRHPNENEILTTQFPYSTNGLGTSRILKNWTFPFMDLVHLWCWWNLNSDVWDSNCVWKVWICTKY